MTARVTVIVPVYNGAATLGATLASIAAQSMADWQAIIVDDGSTDASADIARQFCARDSRFRLIQQANAGVAAARNSGISAAQSPLVAPIDADDLWHPDCLHRLCDALDDAGTVAAFAYGFSRTIDAAGHVLRSVAHHRVQGRALGAMLIHNFVGNGSAAVFRRDAVLAAGGYDGALRAAGVEGCEDYLLMLRLLQRSGVAAVPAFLIGYRWRADAMSQNRLRMVASRRRAVEIFFAGLAPDAAVRARGIVARARGATALHTAWLTQKGGGGWRLVARALLRAIIIDPQRSLLVMADVAAQALTRRAPRHQPDFAVMNADGPPDAFPTIFRQIVWRADARRMQRAATLLPGGTDAP